MKFYKIINVVVALTTFLILGWAAFIQPKGILNLGSLTGFWSYLLIFISLTPIGHLTLGDPSTALPLKTWLGKLLCAQLLLFIFSMSALFAFLGLGPQLAQETMTFGLLKNTVQTYFSWQWIFFPWGIYGICALILAYIVYVKGGAPFVYQITRENCPRRYEAMVKTYVDGAISNASMMAYSLVIASIILLFTYSFEGLIGTHHFYAPFLTISILSFFMPWYMLKRSRRTINRILQKKPSLNQIFFLFIPPLVMLLVLSALGNGWFVKQYAQYYQQFQCRQCSAILSQSALIERFSSLYWGWWIIWAPLASSYVASIVRGRTIRELAWGIFLIPVLAHLFFTLGGNRWVNFFLGEIRQIPLLIILFLLAIISWYGFYRCNQGQKTTAIFYSGFMPDNSSQRSRLWLRDGSKITAISKFTAKLAMNVTTILFLHSIMGWYGIQLQVAVMAALLLGVIYSEITFLLWRLVQDRAWRKPQNIPPFA